jgi:hypothetical protein
MKSKINIIIYILYSLILLILSFNYQYVNNVNLAISNNFDNFNLVYNILKYTEIIIFYIGYGIIVTLFCIDIFNEFKYILIYSILLGVLAVILDLLIKSYISEYQIYIFITSLICVIIGIVIQILVKIKQVKGEENEK